MRRTTVRRTALAASTLSLALLVSACGSDDSSSKEEPKGRTSSNAPAAGGRKALSQAELDQLVLTEADLKDHKVAKPNPGDIAASKTAKTDKPACKPLGDVMALRPVGAPGASVTRKIIAVPKAPGAGASAEEKAKAGLEALGSTITADTLASYEGAGAGAALATLKKAGTDCAGGFTVIVGSDKSTFTKVAPAAYTGGDEAVAFTLTVEMDGAPSTVHLVAVRKGTTLATFYALSLSGKAEQPKPVVDAQMKKLG